jgi:hypothetical protein
VTALEKLVRLAAPSMLEPSALGKVVKDGEPDEDEVHDHLSKECPWYRVVAEGKKPHGEADKWCGAASEGGGALVKFSADGVVWEVALTPRTPEASTVDQPTVPPGGPGLFHVKGLHLPPYIQHLYKHLVGRYGKHQAYGVAVGVVKKWAKGINPGGWKTKSGKGKRTHPDVQAAAQKNVAEWEADRAKGHAQAAKHVAASVVGLAIGDTGSPSFPGDKRVPLPPTPGTARAIFTAHRIDDMANGLAHTHERLDAAYKSPALRGYHMIHVSNHLNDVLNDQHLLVASVHKNYPAEAKELDALGKVIGMAAAVSSDAKAATFAHLLQTIGYHLGHAKRHADLMLDPNPVKEWKFNFDHAHVHAKGAYEHVLKLGQHVMDNYPDEAKALEDLNSGRPALYKAGQKLPPVEHERVARLAAMFPEGRAYKNSLLTLPRPDKHRQLVSSPGGPVNSPHLVSAPGAGKPEVIAGDRTAVLQQEPSQTVSPSPPLPPAVDLPSPKELRSFGVQLSKLTDDDTSHHLAGAVMHLESAAEKMEANSPVSALYSMRSAQMAIQDEWRERIMRTQPRVAYVFSVDAPPGEQAKAKELEAKQHAYIQQLQGAAGKIASMIDRVRRSYFRHAGMEPNTAGGGLAGMPTARLSGEAR